MKRQRKARPARSTRRVRKKPARRVAGSKTAPSATPRPELASGLAPGMHSINTYLAVANVGASMDFLERAFGFAKGVVLPDADGHVRYAEMRHGESVVMLVQRGDGTAATGGAPGLYTYVRDVDAAAVNARSAGAGVTDAEDQAWGDRTSVVTDPDGYRWILATFKKLAPFT